jgi:alkylation response protein AidB-like acyl-CoA dehydrogenase
VNLELTDEQRTVREVFASLFAKESPPERVRAAEPLGHDPAMWEHIIATGALGVAVPETAGGGGAGLLELALIAAEAGRRLAPVPFAEPAAAARLMAACRAQSLLDDALAGSRLVSLATRPGPLEQQILIDGAIADVVVAYDGGELVAAHRPREVRCVANMGSLPLARWTDADHVDVLARGDAARRRYDAALDEARVLRAAALVGLAGEAIDIGAAYARERRAFGIPIGTYQAVAHPLADALVAKDGAELLVWKACWALDNAEASAPALASMAYVFAGETAHAAAQHSLHIHGGYGFMAEYDIQLYYRRARAWVTTFADPRRELQVIATRAFGASSEPRVPVASTRSGG